MIENEIISTYTDDGYTRWDEERTGESIVVESEQLAVDRKIELLELQGNTWQNPNDLNEIKSVGELYVNELGEPILDGGGKEQYKIELESCDDGNLSEIIFSFGRVNGDGNIVTPSGDSVSNLIEVDNLIRKSYVNGYNSWRFIHEYDKNMGYLGSTVDMYDLSLLKQNSKFIRISYRSSPSTGQDKISINKIRVFNNNVANRSKTTILLPQPLMKNNRISDRMYWDDTKSHYCIEKRVGKAVIDFNLMKQPVAFPTNEIKVSWNAESYPRVQFENAKFKSTQASDTRIYRGYSDVHMDFYCVNSYPYVSLLKDNLNNILTAEELYNNLKKQSMTIYMDMKSDSFETIDLPHLNTPFTVLTYSPKTYILNSSNGLSGNMIVKVPFEKPPDPPTRPTGVTFTRGESGSHIISWNESTGASGGYKVYVGEVLLTDTKALTYTHVGELKGFLKVVAYNVAYQTESDLVLVETQPNKPTNFNATNVPSGSNIRFTVNFMDNSYIETGYKVKYKIDRANEVTLNVSPFTNTGDAAYSFDVPVTQVGVEMSIKLLAYNETGESYAENTVVMVTQKPNAPTDFAVALTESSSSYLFNVSFKDASDTELGHRIKYQMDKGSEMVIDIPPTDKGAIIARELTIPIKNINSRIEFRVCSYNQAGETYHDRTLYYTKPANLSITTVGIATTIAWDTIQGIDGCNILLDGKIVETATTNATTINHELYGVLTVVPFVGSVNHMASRQELIHTMPNTPLHTDIGYVETQLGYDVTVGFVDNSNIETHYRVDVRIDNGEKKSIDIDTEFGEIPPNATLDDKRTDIMWLYENETQGNDVSFKGIDGLLVKDLKLQGNTVGGKNLGQDEVIAIVNRENETPIRFITEVVSSGEVKIPCIGRNQHLSMVARGNNVNPNIHINNNTYSSSLTYIDGHTDISTLESTTRYGYIVGRVNAIFDTLHKNRVVYRTGEYVLTGREAWAVDLAKTTDSTTTISSVTLSNCSSLLPQDTIEMISNRMTPVAYNAIGNHLDFAYTTKMYVSFSNSEAGITADDSTPNKVLKCKQYILSNVLKLRYILAKPTEEVINIEVFKGEAFTLMNGDSLDLSTKKVALNGIEKDIYLIDEVANKMVENIPLERTSVVSIGDAIKGSFETSLVIEPELSSADAFEILADNRVKFTQGSTALYGNPINGKSQVEVATLSGNNTINIKGAIKPTLIQGSFPAIKYVSTTFPVDVFKDNINVHVTSCNAIGENAFADSLTKYMSPTPIWTYKQGKILLQWTDTLTIDTRYKVRYKINDGGYHYGYVEGDTATAGRKLQFEFALSETDVAEVSLCAMENGVEEFYCKKLIVSKALDLTLTPPSNFNFEWITTNELKFSWTDDTHVEEDFEFVYSIDGGTEVSTVIPSTTQETVGNTYFYTITLNELQTVIAKVRMRWELNQSEFVTKTATHKLASPTNVKVAIIPSGAMVSWTPSSVATLYRVFVEGVQVGETSESQLLITQEMIGDLYVVAYKDGFESTPSDSVYVKTKPTAPINLDVEFTEALSGYDFNVSFADNSNVETNYKIRYRIDDGNTIEILIDNTTHAIGSIIRGTFHVDNIINHIFISVFACNELGESEIANPQTIYVSPKPRWTYLMDTKEVLLDWIDMFDFETSYKIQYSINAGGYQYATIDSSHIGNGEHITHKIPLGLDDSLMARVCCVSEKDHLYGQPVVGSRVLDTTLLPPESFDFTWIGDGLIEFSWIDNHIVDTGYEFTYRINDTTEVTEIIPSNMSETGKKYTKQIQLSNGDRISAKVRMVWELNKGEYATKSTQYLPVDAKPIEGFRRYRVEDGIILRWIGQPYVEKYVIHMIVDGVETLIETQDDINFVRLDYSQDKTIEVYVIVHYVGGNRSEKSKSMVFKPCQEIYPMTTCIYTAIKDKYELHQIIVGKCKEEIPVHITIWTPVKDEYDINAVIITKLLTEKQPVVTVISEKDIKERQTINTVIASPNVREDSVINTVIYTQCKSESDIITYIKTQLKEKYDVIIDITPARIATLGDSITSGQPGFWAESQTGNPQSQYQYWLEKRLKNSYQVINKGYGRDNSSQLLARFRRDLEPLNASYQITLIGTNDIFEAQKDNQGDQETLDIYMANLRNNTIEMVNISKELGVEPILGNLIPRTGFKGIYREALWNHNKWILQYCTENKIKHIDFYNAGKNNIPPTPLESPTEAGAMNPIFDGDTQYDPVTGEVMVRGNGIHPNVSGYSLMGNCIPLSYFQSSESGLRMYKDKECITEETLDETNIVQKVYMINVPNVVRGRRKFTTRYIKNGGSDQLLYAIFPMNMENCKVTLRLNDGKELDMANGVVFPRGVHKLDIFVEVPLVSEEPTLYLGIASRPIA